MTTRIAFLRGINVGGKNKIGMAELRAMASELGLGSPHTLLQSGNLLFDADGQTDTELEELLERKTLETFKFQVDYQIRSLAELEAVIAADPYPQEATDDPSHVLVAFFKFPLDPAKCELLRGAIRGREYFTTTGREAYFVYPDGIGNSKLTSALMDAKLGQRGTARNWNTILKLAEMGRER